MAILEKITIHSSGQTVTHLYPTGEQSLHDLCNSEKCRCIPVLIWEPPSNMEVVHNKLKSNRLMEKF